MAEAMAGGPPVSGKKGKAGAVDEGPGGVINGTFMKDFRTELAKSGASGCGVCEEKIPKGSVRIGKKEYESTRAKMYGPYDKYVKISFETKIKKGLFTKPLNIRFI
jgi:hypothetical protein